MTPHTATLPAHRSRITGLARAAARLLSGRVHAAGDSRAHGHGWQVTETPGPLGLAGRRYHDPRFTTRRQDAAARNGEPS